MSYWTADICWDIHGSCDLQGFTSLAADQKGAWQRVQDTVALMSGVQLNEKAVIRDFTTTDNGFTVTILAGTKRFECAVREHEGKL